MLIGEPCLCVGRVVERAACWKQGKVLRGLERERGVTAEGRRVVCAGVCLVTFGAHWEEEELSQWLVADGSTEIALVSGPVWESQGAPALVPRVS